MYVIHPIEKYINITDFISAIDVIRPKGFYFAGEMHNFWEIVFIKSGKATATGDANIYNLSEGQLCFHKPMEFHRIWSTENSEPHLNLLAFNATGKGMNKFENMCFSLSANDKEHFSTVFNFFTLSQKALNKFGKDSLEYQTAMSKAASALEVFLIWLIGKDSFFYEPVSADEISYRKIVEIMNEHCEENLSVEQIASLCMMSRSNVKRVFAKYSDIGIAKYFLHLKIRRSMQLLDNGVSVSEVAYRLGFSEVSYFHTVFKRETGITPSQYKKHIAPEYKNIY